MIILFTMFYQKDSAHAKRATIRSETRWYTNERITSVRRLQLGNDIRGIRAQADLYWVLNQSHAWDAVWMARKTHPSEIFMPIGMVVIAWDVINMTV